MIFHPYTVTAILLMASVTYLTRVGGYLVLAGRTLTPRTTSVMNAAPGCVLVAIIAPTLATGRIADIFSLALVTIAATRLSLIWAVLTAVCASALMRQVFG